MSPDLKIKKTEKFWISDLKKIQDFWILDLIGTFLEPKRGDRFFEIEFETLEATTIGTL